MSLLDVEQKTKQYSELYTGLTDLVAAMQGEMKEVQDKYRGQIKSALTKLKTSGENLRNMIELNKDSFDKPKTQTFYDIRVGYAKGKGKKEFDNDITIKLIKKHFPDKAESLIKITEKVISKALDTLSVIELKKIGVEIESAGDEVVIRNVNDEIEKMINKILNSGEKEDTDPIIILGKAS